MAAGLTVPTTELRHITLPTPIGELTIVCSAAGVVATVFDDDEHDPELERIARAFDNGRSRPVVDAADRARGGVAARTRARAARREVLGYLGGSHRAFVVPPDLTLVSQGFGRQVLEAVATIPFGELWTYGDLAGLVGRPRAARAAGSALAGCPIELFVPCHRVVHAGGTLGGYGRHVDRKRWLLRHEGAIA